MKREKGERRNKGTKKRRKTVGGDGRGMGPVLEFYNNLWVLGTEYE